MSEQSSGSGRKIRLVLVLLFCALPIAGLIYYVFTPSISISYPISSTSTIKTTPTQFYPTTYSYVGFGQTSACSYYACGSMWITTTVAWLTTTMAYGTTSSYEVTSVTTSFSTLALYAVYQTETTASIIVASVLVAVVLLIVSRHARAQVSKPMVPDTTPTARLDTVVTKQEAQPRASTKFCRECGAKIPRDSVFCEKCGSKLI